MKYIIKNCPNCYNYGEHAQDYWCEFEHNNTLFTNPCKESDCLLKKIVELVKRDVGSEENMFLVSRYTLRDEILELLDIEECE